MSEDLRLRVAVPDQGYHRGLIACQVACPVHTDARGYVRAIAAGDFDQAYLIARGPNPFASVCGRICGAPCEAACRRGKMPRVDTHGTFVGHDRAVSIRALKRFACEQAAAPESGPPVDLIETFRNHTPAVAADAEEMAGWLRATVSGRVQSAAGERVAIIGGGPAGLSAAHDLALMGCRPVVFELERSPGGMLGVGVPEYRLPRELIRREVAVIEALGVEIRYGVQVGKTVSFAELREGYDAVIIAVGAKRSRGLGLPGERGPRVFGGVDLLRAVAVGEPIDIGEDVVVIGGGNVAYDVARTVVRQAAIDAARTAARLTATRRVRLASLEVLEEMPADTTEILEGDEEGIERLNGWGPVAIERDETGAVTGVQFRRCLRAYDEQRRFAPVFEDETRRTVPCDTVLLAAGQTTDLAFLDEGGDDIDQIRPGWPKLDPDSLATTGSGVFVAGDLAHGTRLVIDAVASGKRAARSVYQHLTGRTLTADAVTAHIPIERYRREPGYERIRRVPIPVLSPEARLDRHDAVVETGYGRVDAVCEASRCLDCGVTPVFDGARCVLCGGCADVCPTQCLKLVALADVESSPSLDALVTATLGAGIDLAEHTVIIKDEDRCIRCALCAMRCPADAITMERVAVDTRWSAQ